ncbi:MAG: carbon-nitrogen hydrolase family protein [Bacteroidia bacterium]|nr:carbon-nitrogen hydrolase family protein [Bacteroidia bacterium]
MNVGILQTAPVVYDRAGSLAKLETHLRAAAAQGVRLVVVGETWFTGYPSYLDHVPGIALWDDPAHKQVFAQLAEGAIVVPGPETEHLARLCTELDLGLVLGATERVPVGYGSGTLFNALLTFAPGRGLVNHHRKLVPTYTEKLVYGPGDGAGLQAVALHGVRVGGLVCWEHWMPHARQALHLSGEQIHVAVWPTVHELHQVASRSYAFEGRCFVLAAGQLQQVRDLPPALTLPPELAETPDRFLLRGGSCIVGPDGQYVVPPVFETDTLISATLDLTRCTEERMTLDVTGHYSRPDVFGFSVDRSRPA